MKTNVLEKTLEMSVLSAYGHYKNDFDEIPFDTYFIVRLNISSGERQVYNFTKEHLLSSILNKKLRRSIKDNIDFIDNGNVHCVGIPSMDTIVMIVKLSKVKEMYKYYSSLNVELNN